jgi:hypothetical protein
MVTAKKGKAVAASGGLSLNLKCTHLHRTLSFCSMPKMSSATGTVFNTLGRGLAFATLAKQSGSLLGLLLGLMHQAQDRRFPSIQGGHKTPSGKN